MKVMDNGVERDATPDEIAEIHARQTTAQSTAQDEAVKRYDGVVQKHIDSTAQSFGYGDPNRPEVSPILHAISYADEPAVVKFQAEGRLLRAWRSHVWATAASILNSYNAGERGAPTDDQLLMELPAAPTAADVDAEMTRLSA